MTQPLIGITTGRSPGNNPKIRIDEAYIQAIAQAGGLPVLIPLGLPELLGRLSGILFTGGGDIHPASYASDWHPKVASVDNDRDRVEIYLAQQAVAQGLPFLGICRGLQVINVALGGSLYVDIPDQLPGALEHDQPDEQPRDRLAHTVQVDESSRLAGLLGAGPLPVNSLHHQGIRRLSGGLQGTACAPDGLIEAIELPGHPFGLAVQWHPECLQAHEGQRKLFRAFVEACRE